MKLLEAGFLWLALLILLGGVFPQPIPTGGLVAVVERIPPPPPPPPTGGFGGFSTILALIIPIILLLALPRCVPRCPAGYTPTPNDPNTCIRFFNANPADRVSFTAARTACEADGGNLLQLNPGNFDNIRLLADANKGTPTCDFWVGATESSTTNGVWSALNGDPIPASPFFNPTTDAVAVPAVVNECGFLNQLNGYYLLGATCTDLKCFICQRNKIC